VKGLFGRPVIILVAIPSSLEAIKTSNFYSLLPSCYGRG
jgi:hypothetical protein